MPRMIRPKWLGPIIRRNKVRRPPVEVEAGVLRFALPCGLTAIASAADRELLDSYNWCACQCANGRLYIRSHRDGKHVYMHRLVAGAAPKQTVDHVSGDTLDNRRENIRICSPAENSRNRKPNTGRRFKGVRWMPQDRRWAVRILAAGKLHTGGKRFRTEEEAARAYDELAKKHHGEFARLNFPTEVTA